MHIASWFLTTAMLHHRMSRGPGIADKRARGLYQDPVWSNPCWGTVSGVEGSKSGAQSGMAS